TQTRISDRAAERRRAAEQREISFDDRWICQGRFVLRLARRSPLQPRGGDRIEPESPAQGEERRTASFRRRICEQRASQGSRRTPYKRSWVYSAIRRTPARHAASMPMNTSRIHPAHRQDGIYFARGYMNGFLVLIAV